MDTFGSTENPSLDVGYNCSLRVPEANYAKHIGGKRIEQADIPHGLSMLKVWGRSHLVTTFAFVSGVRGIQWQQATLLQVS